MPVFDLYDFLLVKDLLASCGKGEMLPMACTKKKMQGIPP
jgi:hypothetical protein